MMETSLLDLASAVIVISTGVVAYKHRGAFCGQSLFHLFCGFLGVFLLRDLTNATERALDLTWADTLGDHIGLLTPLAWMFLLYAMFEHHAKEALAGEVHQREHAEDALRESEGRYRMLVENQRDLVVRLDRDRRFLFVSPSCCKAFGKTEDELLDMRFDDLADNPEGADMRWCFTYLAHPPHACEHQEQMRTLLGPRWFEWSSRAVLDASGQVNEIIATGRDITDRRRAEEERLNLESRFQQAQKLESLGILAGGIAHDFNNLLMAIMGNAELALQDLPEGASARVNISEIDRASRRAAELCRQMLAYSGRGHFELSNVDLSELVREMTQILSVSVSKKASIECAFAEGLPPVEADSAQIRQVVLNLIINASEAIGDRSGRVRITTGVTWCDDAFLGGTWTGQKVPPGRYCFIEVSDNGCGMNAETMRRIFDPFFSTKFTGRGLGLAAVLGIVRGHRGAIKIASHEDKGTVFQVYFPALDGVASPDGEQQPGKEDRWRGSGTVLLADDEEIVRLVGRRMLEHLGFQVRAAADGREAVDLFLREPDSFVCVILDLTMPHLDGEEAFRAIRAAHSNVPVLLTSGYSEQEVTRRFSGQDIAGFVQKPFTSASLTHALRSILEGIA